MGRFGRRRLLKAGLVGGAALGLAMPAVAKGPRVIRFASQQPINSIYSSAMEIFAKEAAKLSSGGIKVENYPNSQLGDATQMMTGVQLGTVSMALATPAWYARTIKQTDVFTLPYIVSSIERLRAALDGPLGARINGFAEASGLKFFGGYLMGSRSLVNNVRPIYKPADVAGLKMRVIGSQVYLRTFRALGANPVAMDGSELYLGVQQHVLDGFEYPLPDLIDYKLYEVTKYLSLDNHVTDFFFISINKPLWDGMSQDEQRVVASAMRTSIDWEWKEQPQNIITSLEKLKGLMQVNEIAPADLEQFAAVTRPVYATFESTLGKDLLDQAILELGAA